MRLDWKSGERSSLTLDGRYIHDVAGRRDERAQATAPFSFLNLEHEITDAGHVLGRWTRQLDEKNAWSVQAYWDRVSRLADNLPVRFGEHLRRGPRLEVRTQQLHGRRGAANGSPAVDAEPTAVHMGSGVSGGAHAELVRGKWPGHSSPQRVSPGVSPHDSQPRLRA
jgi:hypothetical protein